MLEYKYRSCCILNYRRRDSFGIRQKIYLNALPPIRQKLFKFWWKTLENIPFHINKQMSNSNPLLSKFAAFTWENVDNNKTIIAIDAVTSTMYPPNIRKNTHVLQILPMDIVSIINTYYCESWAINKFLPNNFSSDLWKLYCIIRFLSLSNN